MKRFDEAVSRFEEALAIRRKVFGDNHPLTHDSLRALQAAHEGLKDPSNAIINQHVSDQRICGHCNKVATKLDKCANCERIYYCSIECMDADWLRHGPQCAVWCGCGFCRTKEGKLKHCSGCRLILYCSDECQKQHWSSHKGVCRKWTEQNEAKKK